MLRRDHLSRHMAIARSHGMVRKYKRYSADERQGGGWARHFKLQPESAGIGIP
jgi:hypothetical protein